MKKLKVNDFSTKTAKETNNILTGNTPLIISQNVKSVNLKKELKYPIYLLL